MFLFSFIDLVLWSRFLFYFIFDCVSLTFAFCIPNLVYLILCHWSNMYNYQSKKKICYVQYFVEYFFFLAVFPRGGINLWCKKISCEYSGSSSINPPPTKCFAVWNQTKRNHYSIKDLVVWNALRMILKLNFLVKCVLFLWPTAK